MNYSLAFLSGSKARGTFMAVLHITNGMTNFNQSFYFVQNISAAQMANTIAELSGGMYMALAYDVEKTGEITSDRAADQQSVTITGTPTSPGQCKSPLLSKVSEFQSMTQLLHGGATLNISFLCSQTPEMLLH